MTRGAAQQLTGEQLVHLDLCKRASPGVGHREAEREKPALGAQAGADRRGSMPRAAAVAGLYDG